MQKLKAKVEHLRQRLVEEAARYSEMHDRLQQTDGESAELALKKIELQQAVSQSNLMKVELEKIELHLKQRPQIAIIQRAIVSHGR